MRKMTFWLPQAVVRGLGSMWFGAGLLVLILVAMACATVFESMHGTEQALAEFYGSWWFKLLLVLLAVNVGMAILLRLPLSRRLIGFTVTHVSILVVLAGALVTERFGVDGQLGLLEGDTQSHLSIPRDTLTVARRGDQAEASADLSRLRPGEHPAGPAVNLGDLSVKVADYLPDSLESEEVVNDNPQRRLAVEVTFSNPRGTPEPPVWVFADEPASVGPMAVLFREVDEDELRELSEAAPSKPDTSVGMVRFEYQDATFEFPVEECREKAVPIGQTGYTIKVLEYMPHARVGANNQLVNASDQPVNPTIEVELVGPEGTVKRPVFAKFPGFWSTHGPGGTPGPKVTFVASGDAPESAPLSVLHGPEGKLYARFAFPGRPPVVEELILGEPCQSPWMGRRLTVLRRFDHARTERTVVPRTPARRDRVPAVLLEVTSPPGSERKWLQKGQTHTVAAEGSICDLVYGNKRLPLGFSVTLKDFEIGHYPGTMRPRSFESLITILDPATGRKLHRVVSMNHPVTFGGFTFYQSSYRQDGGRMVSFLSVSRDPGQPLVFAGYVGLLVGMVLVLSRRILDRRDAAALPPGAGASEKDPPKRRSSRK